MSEANGTLGTNRGDLRSLKASNIGATHGAGFLQIVSRRA